MKDVGQTTGWLKRLEHGGDTLIASSASTTTSLESGSGSGFYTFNEDSIYDDEPSTFSDSSSSNATVNDTATETEKGGQHKLII